VGDYKRDSEQDNSMDCPIWGTDDISDEELLKEFEAVKNMAVPLPIPSPSPDEFEKIWARIQEERAESKNVPESDQPEHPKVIKPRFGWKRLAAVGLIACLVAGSGCMVAMGTKSYFYRGRVRDENNIVYNNDTNIIAVNGEEEAYSAIYERTGMESLRLGYIPADMTFIEVQVGDGYAALKFSYHNETIYFVQTKFERKVSFNYDTDAYTQHEIHNKWLNVDMDIYSEKISDDDIRYETTFVYKGVYYRLVGVMELTEFINIAERITF
jgi:hypothetical protein